MTIYLVKRITYPEYDVTVVDIYPTLSKDKADELMLPYRNSQDKVLENHKKMCEEIAERAKDILVIQARSKEMWHKFLDKNPDNAAKINWCNNACLAGKSPFKKDYPEYELIEQEMQKKYAVKLIEGYVPDEWLVEELELID